MSGNGPTRWTGLSWSVDQTQATGAALGELSQPGDLIGLIGELGAGKTHFVRGMANGMGLTHAPVTSPTFVMIQEYEPAQDQPQCPALIHVDAYRLKSLEDLESIGWDIDAAELRQHAVVAVEWADRLTELLENALTLKLAHSGDENHRQLTVRTCDSWDDRMPQLIDRFEAILKQDPTD